MTATAPASAGRFVAVIGDLVASRQLSNRAQVQARLAEVLQGLNREFHEHVVSRFVVTLGDEFQGLLALEAPLDKVWWQYEREMRQATRFGFGIGALSTSLKSEALGMDGPCFHAARSALSRAHRERFRFVIEVAGRSSLTKALRGFTPLLSRTMDRWTEIQRETVFQRARFDVQAGVADFRGVSTQAVSRSLEASLGEEVIEALRSLVELARWDCESAHRPTEEGT